MKKISILLVMFLLIASFSLAVLEDDFNRPDNAILGTATNGEIWNEGIGSNNDWVIFNNTLFHDVNPLVNDTTNAQAILNLDTVDTTYYSMKFTALSNGANNQSYKGLLFIQGSNGVGESWYIRVNNQIEQIQYAFSGFTNIIPLVRDKEYFLEIVNISYGSQTYDIWIDGVQIITGAPFNSPISNTNQIRLVSQDGEYIIDDLRTSIESVAYEYNISQLDKATLGSLGGARGGYIINSTLTQVHGQTFTLPVDSKVKKLNLELYRGSPVIENCQVQFYSMIDSVTPLITIGSPYQFNSTSVAIGTSSGVTMPFYDVILYNNTLYSFILMCENNPQIRLMGSTSNNYADGQAIVNRNGVAVFEPYSNNGNIQDHYFIMELTQNLTINKAGQVTIYEPNTDFTLNSTGTNIFFNYSAATGETPITYDVYFTNGAINRTVLLDTSSTTFTQSIDKDDIVITDDYNILVVSKNFFSENITISPYTINLCINNYQPVYSDCVDDEQVKTYNDTNTCSQQYDVPNDNNTLVSCDDGILSDSELLTQELNNDTVKNILLVFAVLVGFGLFMVLGRNNITVIIGWLLLIFANIILHANRVLITESTYSSIYILASILGAILFFISSALVIGKIR